MECRTLVTNKECPVHFWSAPKTLWKEMKGVVISPALENTGRSNHNRWGLKQFKGHQCIMSSGTWAPSPLVLIFFHLLSVPCRCADGPSAPRRRLRALPRGFPDGGNGGGHSRNLAAALSRDGSHPCWHGDHLHHPRWGSARISFSIFTAHTSPDDPVKMRFLIFIFFPQLQEKREVRDVAVGGGAVAY